MIIVAAFTGLIFQTNSFISRLSTTQIGQQKQSEEVLKNSNWQIQSQYKITYKTEWKQTGKLKMPIKQARHSQDDSENQDKTHGRAKKRLAQKLKNERQKISGAYNGKNRYKNYIHIIYRKKIFKEKRFDLQTL